jgi:hypothetical protein
MDADGTPTVGTRCHTTRRIGGADRTSVSEVTHIDPPKTWGVRGIDGRAHRQGRGLPILTRLPSGSVKTNSRNP